MTSRCSIRLSSATTLALSLALATSVHARQSAEPVKKTPDAGESVRRQGFSVVLLLGDMQGGESLEGIPVAARKALTDMKDFLPFKHYRLLDSQWTLCCSGSTSAITRLRGLDEQEYELELRASPLLDVKNLPAFDPTAISVRFFLREPSDPYWAGGKSDAAGRDGVNKGLTAPAELNARIAQINQELFALEREKIDLTQQIRTVRSQAEVGLKDPAELKRMTPQLDLIMQRISTLKNELSSLTSTKTSFGKAVIDTTFRMDIGETVVVGTSGLKGGNKALIALLTAVGTRPKTR